MYYVPFSLILPQPTGFSNYKSSLSTYLSTYLPTTPPSFLTVCEGAVHLKFGFRAAPTSSNLPIDFVYGDPLAMFGFSLISSAVSFNADANLSNVSLLS